MALPLTDGQISSLNSLLQTYRSDLSDYTIAYNKSLTYTQGNTRTLENDFDIVSNYTYGSNINTSTILDVAGSGSTGCFTQCLSTPTCLGASYVNSTCYFQLLGSLATPTTISSTNRYMIPKNLKIGLLNMLNKLTVDINNINVWFSSNSANISASTTAVQNSVNTMNQNYQELKVTQQQITDKITLGHNLDTNSGDTFGVLTSQNIQFELLLIVFYIVVFGFFKLMGITSTISYTILGMFVVITGMIIANRTIFF